MKAPRPSLDAFRYYNTMIFHGWLRLFVTVVLASTGAALYFGGFDRAYKETIETLHIIFGLLGVYLIVAHVAGFFLNSVMKMPRVQEAKKHMSDSGWIMIVLATVSLITGLMLIWRRHLPVGVKKVALQIHIFAAVTYLVMVAVHIWYYMRHWKPALRSAPQRKTAGAVERDGGDTTS